MLPTLALLAALHVSSQIEHRYLPESTGAELYLQIDLLADGEPDEAPRVPVNAVMIIDRSGSMAGVKIERARDAARAMVRALGPRDRLTVVDFASDVRVLVPSTPATPDAKERALMLISSLQATSGTNMSAAFDAAAPQLREGHAPGRIDKVFLASDGQANEGIFARPALLALAVRDFGEATVSTFGIGEDYDEQFMTQLALQSGGRARYVANGEVLASAFAGELSRATRTAAQDVRLRIDATSGARVSRILGFEGEGTSVRVPDIACGEERRILVKLLAPPGRGTAQLAQIEVRYRDARGEPHSVRTAADATYTADELKLGAEKPNKVTWQGAMAEMADAASNALRYQAEGDLAKAKAEQSNLLGVARRAAVAAPAPAAAALSERAEAYSRQLSASGAGDQKARKQMAETAADAVTAPAPF